MFAACVPSSHVLRRALEVIDWVAFRAQLASYYSPNMGRPGEDPVLMLKLVYLCYHYRLSDGAVMQRTQIDMAFRYFLPMGVRDSRCGKHGDCVANMRRWNGSWARS